MGIADADRIERHAVSRCLLAAAGKSSPSVVTPSVKITIPANDEPRYSCKTDSTAEPRRLERPVACNLLIASWTEPGSPLWSSAMRSARSEQR